VKARFGRGGVQDLRGEEVIVFLRPHLPQCPQVTSSFFVPRTTPGAKPSIRSIVKIKEKQEVDKLVGKCFLWSDIPFNTSKNNPFYRPHV
jgi:hypothetical protein